jgi:hypothetical protein
MDPFRLTIQVNFLLQVHMHGVSKGVVRTPQATRPAATPEMAVMPFRVDTIGHTPRFLFHLMAEAGSFRKFLHIDLLHLYDGFMKFKSSFNLFNVKKWKI